MNGRSQHIRQVIQDLLRSPGFHYGVYYRLAAEAQSRVWETTDQTAPFFVERLNLGLLPWAIRITDLCRTLWPHHTLRPERRRRLSQALMGMGIAAGGLGSLLAIQTACGWLRWEGQGWSRASWHQIAAYTGASALGHAATAYDEEMFFRGHGLSVLSQALGPWVASTLLTTAFVLYHPLDPPWIAISAQGLSGFNMLMMRQLSGDMAMPLAYHWTWNWLQSGVIVARPGVPALFPVTIEGPQQWTGTIGESTPGILMVLVQAVLALILGWLGWRSRSPALKIV